MAVCRPFSIYKRLVGRKKRLVFYVQFRDENGKRLSAISSGQSSRAAAETLAIELLKNGTIPTKAHLTFGKYAEPPPRLLCRLGSLPAGISDRFPAPLAEQCSPTELRAIGSTSTET